MRAASASALTIALLCSCKSDDGMLTPDEEDADAAAVRDSSAPLDAGADDAPDEDTGSGTHTAEDPDCDLNGVWIARQNTLSVALGLQQYANNWYYLEFTQDSEQVVVSKHMDCGIEVRSALNLTRVELAPATTRALSTHNSQVGRAGSFAKRADDTCALEIERFWSVRGLSEERYAPEPRSLEVSLQQLQSENPLPSETMGDATEDWDDDGFPGIAWQVTGIASGSRHSGQRDWTRWFSAEGYEVTAAREFTTDLLVRSEFASEEVVYEASDPSLTELAQTDASAEHTLRLRFLGRTRDDARARAIIQDDDFQTCLAIQEALPALTGLK
jgi:hypothetical protein